MHKLLTVFIILLFALTAKAQTEKGTVYLGGSVAYSSQKINSSSSTYNFSRQLNLRPTVGMFLNSKWAIGITPMYQYNRDTSHNQGPGYTVSSSSKVKLLGGGIDVRYYIPLGKQFAFFPQFNTTYLTSVGKNQTDDHHVFVVTASPNFAFFPSKKVAINLTYGALAYANERIFPKDGSESQSFETFAFSANGGISLGVSYHFTK